MIVFIILNIVLWISFGIKIKFKLKQEESIAISMFGSTIIAYVFGVVELLWISPYIIGIIAVISMIYVIIKLIKKEEKIINLMTLPTIIYIITMCLIYYLVKDMTFRYYDEFMFWGTNLKTMLNKSCLWANAKVDGIHLTYPPFTAVAQYLFCKYNGGFNEGVTYFGIIALIFTSIMPLLKNEQYSIKLLFKTIATLAITYLATQFFCYDMANLSVDCILGVLFAVLMYMVYKQKEKKDYILIITLLIAITLVKLNGILFAGIAIMQLFFKEAIKLIKQKEKNPKKIFSKFLFVVILLLIVIVTYTVWNMYCTLNGKQVDDRHDKNYVENINISEFINSIFFKEKARSRNSLIASRFWEAILKFPITITNHFNSTISVFLILICLFAVFAIISDKRMDLLANILSISIGFVLYLISNLIMFMFVFQWYQGEVLMGFDRYIQTYMLAMTLILTYCILDKIEVKTIIISCLIILFFKCEQWTNSEKLIQEEYIIDDYTKQNASYILDNVKDTDKVYIIDQKLDAGFEFMATKYLISPIQTNLLYEWNIGASIESIRTYYTMPISEQGFLNKIINEEYDYIYIIYIEESFLEQYKNIFSQEVIDKLEEMVEKNKTSRTNGILINIDTDIIK